MLGLDGADKGTVAATALDVEHSLHVGNTAIGLLLGVVGLVSALATVPAGTLIDRWNRTRLLTWSALLWGVAMVAGSLATSYSMLLGSRVALGVTTATAGPAVASLVGDLFPRSNRGRIYGHVLAGELVGTGLGFVISGNLAAAFGWRVGFAWLAVPSIGLALALKKFAEPARSRAAEEQDTGSNENSAWELARESDAEPDESLVLHEDPTGRDFWWSVRYVLRVRTNVIVIVASALGYFFFAGLRGFAVVFAREHYGLGQSAATSLLLVVGVGSLVGVSLGGRIADRLLRRGVLTARIRIPVVALLAVPPAIAPGLWSKNIAIALPLLVLGAGILGAANPPQDAARLDIMHPRLWGRAEAVRTVVRALLEAAAPVAFGFLADHVFTSQGEGLRNTFIVMLLPLFAAGGIAALALRTYPRDVATAAESLEQAGRDSRERVGVSSPE